MDFLDPKKRKSHQIRLFIGYGLMGLLIAIVSVLLLLQAYGYSYNFRTGDIAQNGLLFVDSHPVSATLSLNGEAKGVTSQRLVLREGAYDISLQREGYHAWQKSVALKGGVIERFLYPFLFPIEIESSDIALYAKKLDFATQSPDRQWLVSRVPDSIASFEVLSLSEETPVPFRFELPENIMTRRGAAHQLELVEWSTDNRHFVIKHNFEGGTEYLLVDRENPTLSRNLTAVIPVPFSALRLRDKKFDSYYLYVAADKTLSRFDLGTTAPQAVLSDVLEYHSHGDDEMLYVTDKGAPAGSVLLRMIDNGEVYTIRELKKSDKYLLELARYEGAWYLVAGSSADDRVYIFRDPVELLKRNAKAKIMPVAALRLEGASKVSFSQNARIIAAQSGSKLAVYDNENKKTFHYDTELKLHPNAAFTWMDGHRLTAISEGQQKVFDFDGSNMRSLGNGYDDGQPYFDRDYTAVFTFAPSIEVEGRTALQRTELIVEE